MYAEKKIGVKGNSTLPWSVRYKVALGIAEAIAYLHNGTERCVVHRDIKPSNILLSSKKIPKVNKTSCLNVGFSCSSSVHYKLLLLYVLYCDKYGGGCSCVILD